MRRDPVRHFWRVLIFTLFCISGGTVPAGATDPVEFDYMMNCQGCHLPDGRGFPERNVPDLRNHLGAFLTVEGGRAFLVQVPGSAQSDLDDTRLTRVLNWMLFRFSPDALSDDFTPYTPEEVGQLRLSPLIDVQQVRAALIDKIKAHNQDPALEKGPTP